MAFAQRIITSNSAGDQEFTFTFDYIKEEHIKVFVNFVEKAQGTGSNEFQVITNTTPKKVRLNTGLASANTRVEIRRISSLSTPLVDFTDGSTLTATDLDTAEKQSLFIDQELDDALKQGVSIDASTGLPSLTNQRLSNVADPVSAQDVVTKAYLERSGSITSTQIADGTIVNADINASAAIAKSKLASLDIVNADVNASAAIAGSKLADASITYSKIQNVSATNRILGRDSSGAGVIEEITPANLRTMINVEDGATADQSAAEIRTLVESASDSNVFTDADHTKLNAIEASADVTDAANVDAAGAVMNSDTTTAAMQFVIDEDSFGSNLNTKVPTQQSVKAYITATSQPLDSELSQLAGMQSATASKLASSTALTSDIADLNQLDGMAKQTTITDDDTKFPTSGAVVDFVAAQIAPLGGLEVIATDAAFPNTQPSSGVVISISDAGGVAFNGSGTSTTPRTVGGATVTINNAPSSLNNETLAAGVGLMVSSTGAGQIYNYHKILGKEDDIKQLSDDINDFNARYRVVDSNPTSNNDAGDLIFNRSTQKLLVFNATSNAFEEAQSVGNFFISTLSPAFDGSTQDFTITNAPANAQQILLSINGVIQKPNSGTSTPSEGFALTGNTVKLAAAPPTGSTYFAIVLGSTVNIGTPSNNTVSTAIIQNGAVTGEKLASNLDLIDNQKIRLGTGNDLQIYHDGSHHYILSSNGHIHIVGDGTNQVKITAKNNEQGILITPDASVELYYDNSKKLETYSGGVQITGNVYIPDGSNSGNYVGLGNAADLRIFHDGTHSRIKNSTGDLFINSDSVLRLQNSGGAHYAKFFNNGAVELYHNNSKKFETSTNGCNLLGTQQNFEGVVKFDNTSNSGLDMRWEPSSNSLDFVDTVKARFGTGNDLQIYHDGTHSYLYNLTGELKNRAAIWKVVNAANSEKIIEATENGSVDLYYDNSKKFETYNQGVSITGNLVASGTIYANTNIEINNVSPQIFLVDSNNNSDFAVQNNNGSFIVRDTTNSANTLVIDSNGYVTKPKNPVFHAFGGPSNVALNTDIVFGQERFDVGGGYNTSNGIYTVPRTGYYHFYGQVYRQATESDAWWGFFINGGQKSEARLQNNYGSDNGRGYATLQCSLYWYCSAGDQVKMRVGNIGAIHCNNTLSYFCGNLVG